MTITRREFLSTIPWTIGLALGIGAIGALPTVPEIAEASSRKRVLPVGTKYPWAVERWRPMIVRYFPKDRTGHTPRRLQQEALAIIWAESDGNPRSGRQDGIWQLSNCHGKSEWQRHDPETSTRIAARLYAAQGGRWRPAWTTARGLGLR